MNWISLITTLIIFIAWMFAMHKWKETERKLEIKGTEISNLKRDVEYWRELAKLRSIELNTTRMKAENEWANEYEVEYQTDTTGKYIIEVNQGVYLRKSIITTFRNVEVVYNFTDDFEKASKFKDVKECKKIAKQCKGKVLYDSPNWEVV
ncbi:MULTISPECIES: hypothetical protein [Staphylococcus]|nr:MULTISPECIES: hypothetical protein [Staphylococcus]KAB2161303.1 hypothetical protein F9B20_04075 [Staphylococcus epidermidis]KAB2237242.1 hypothetical protein F9B27_01945 [Staphylococcus epidermidis]KAB2246658.1 hypothetical protein F9B49_02125 [Staphylococcus epidermidis]KAB2249490.1 hypothetical protein F9B29_01250 [Staphylococcus epidermidis]KAB2256729.1 hypothetical protein F9B51_01250 [Staphylococcus epidermidis]